MQGVQHQHVRFGFGVLGLRVWGVLFRDAFDTHCLLAKEEISCRECKALQKRAFLLGSLQKLGLPFWGTHTKD